MIVLIYTMPISPVVRASQKLRFLTVYLVSSKVGERSWWTCTGRWNPEEDGLSLAWCCGELQECVIRRPEWFVFSLSSQVNFSLSLLWDKYFSSVKSSCWLYLFHVFHKFVVMIKLNVSENTWSAITCYVNNKYTSVWSQTGRSALKI